MLSFQAMLTDAGGDPLPGPTVDLEFSLYDGIGALVEGPIVLNDVPITGGVVDGLVPVSPSSFDGSERLLGVTVNPPAAELAPRMALVSVPYAFRVDRVASEELDDDIELGDAATTGSLTVYRTTSNTPSIVLSGANSQISTYGGDGLEQIRLWGASWGEMLLSDGTDNDTTAKLTATFNSGGELILYDADGGLSVFADGDVSGGSLTLYDASADESVVVSGGDGSITAEGEVSLVDTIGGAVVGHFARTGSGALLETYDLGGNPTAIIGTSGVGGGGFAQLYNSNNALTFNIDGDAGDAGFAMIGNSSGAGTINLDGDEGDGGALLTLWDGTRVTIDLDANASGGGAGVTLSNSAGANTIVLDADSSDDGMVRLFDADGNRTIELHSDSSHSAGQISLLARDTGGTLRETVEIIASEGDDGSGQSNNGGQIILRQADGTTSITLDAEQGAGGGDGRIITPVLQITGGADLSENFDVSGRCEPGYVVCIDAQNPGQLVVSSKAYDRTVAGVISGAKDIRPGMLMGQRGSEADGKLPVALTGRVYVYADATYGAITPGDLLTTSDTAGHVMKVRDYTRAHGAIIGKAMSGLAEGKGLVLVLVTLQ
ncbi:MAG: hypothetical protein GY778_04535 [bacterium]|nr:hypothetical protein [bacterium]